MLQKFHDASDHMQAYLRARALQDERGSNELSEEMVRGFLVEASREGCRSLAKEADERLAQHFEREDERAGGEGFADVTFGPSSWSDDGAFGTGSVTVEGEVWEIFDYRDQLEPPPALYGPLGLEEPNA